MARVLQQGYNALPHAHRVYIHRRPLQVADKGCPCLGHVDGLIDQGAEIDFLE